MESNIKNKRILTFLLTISVLTLLLFSENLFAISPTVNIEPTQEESNDIVTLKVSGLTHVETSGFKIRINYNNSAFDYLSVDYPESLSGSTKSADINDEGILTVDCSSSYLPMGENDYFYVNLRAKSSGAASVLIANSTFYDLQGNKISGSMLKYFTIEIKPFTNRGSVSEGQGDGGSSQLTNQQEEPENSSTLTDASATTTEASTNNDNKKTEAQSSTPEVSNTTTHSSSFSTEKTNETEATKVKYDFRMLILISALIVLVLLVFYILKKFNKK